MKKSLSYRKLFERISIKLKTLFDPTERAQTVHQEVDKQIKTLFNDPMVDKLVTCKKGCSSCCHTQVSVTQDEVELIIDKISGGLQIDMKRLEKQAQTRNDSNSFFRMSYQDRKCVFLNEANECTIYESRPAVCRTNYVISDPKDCETISGVENPIRLLNTYKADMVIMAAYKSSPENGALPYMLMKGLGRKISGGKSKEKNKNSEIQK